MPRKNQQLSVDVEQEIGRRYAAGEAAQTLNREFNLPDRTGIYRILRRCGVKARPNGFHQRKHTVDHGYFSTLDRPIKSWLLGLMASDGSVRRRNGTYEIVFAAKDEDRETIERFILEIGGTSYPRFVNGKKYISWHAWSPQLGQDLIRFGITPGKSLSLKIHWELIPTEHLKFFLLGVVDGDGYLLDQIGQRRLQITTGSKTFAMDLRERLPGSKILTAPPVNENCHTLYRVHISGRDRILPLLQWLYTDLPFFSLSRKNKLARGIIDWATTSQHRDAQKPALARHLADQYHAGETGIELAREHGLSLVTVYKMIRSTGGEVRPSSRAIKKRLRELDLLKELASDMGRVKVTAKRLGVSPSALYNHLQHIGRVPRDQSLRV